MKFIVCRQVDYALIFPFPGHRISKFKYEKFMPNSEGCIHAHPDDLKTIDNILKDELGVKVRPNPFGKLPYPYQPQGLLSVEEIVSVRPPSAEDY